MPPRICRGRDTTNINTYIENPKLKKNIFIQALDNSGYLQAFKGQLALNECIFTYPNTEWYSVYLLDSSGQRYWNSSTGKAAQIYFKVGYPSSDTTKPFVVEETTEQPPGLPENVCRINEKGNCEMTPSIRPTTGTRGRKPKATAVAESVPSEEVSPEVMARLSTLSLNPEEVGTGPKGSKKQIPREYFEQIKDKAIIVQWMIDNMDTTDLMECIKRGSVSKEDLAKAESVIGSAPSSSYVPPSAVSPADIQAMQAAQSMSQSERLKMFKKASKEDIIAEINAISDPTRKMQNIVLLCQGAGKRFVVDTLRSGKMAIFRILPDGKKVQVDQAAINRVLDECATKEAKRTLSLMASRWAFVMKMAAKEVKTGKRAAVLPDVVPDKVSIDKIINETQSRIFKLPPEPRFIEIAGLLSMFPEPGFVSYVSRKNPSGKLTIFKVRASSSSTNSEVEMTYPQIQQLFGSVIQQYANVQLMQNEQAPQQEVLTVNEVISTINEASGKERLELIQALAIDLHKNYIIKLNDYTKDYKLYVVYDDGEEEQVDDADIDGLVMELANEYVATQSSSFGRRGAKKKCCLFGKKNLRKNKIKVKCTMKTSSAFGKRLRKHYLRRMSHFGIMSKSEAKKLIAKEVILFVKDVKKQVLTKQNIKAFFGILFSQKFKDLVAKKNFKELVKSRKEVLTGIKAAFKTKPDGQSSDVSKFFSDRMSPVLQVHFAKFAEHMDILQEELCKRLSSVLSTAIMEFLVVVFAETGPFDALVPILRLKTIPDLVKKTCEKMTKKLIDKLKAAAAKGLNPVEIAAKVEEAGQKEVAAATSAFGKRKRGSKRRVVMIFKRAAKKCKGKSNYRTCMKKTLRSMHRKGSSFGKRRRPKGPSVCKNLSEVACGGNPNCTYTKKKRCVSKRGTRQTGRKKVVYQGPMGPPSAFGKRYTKRGGRKSPGVSATLFKVGSRKRGLDRKMWKVKKASNGVKRWVRT